MTIPDSFFLTKERDLNAVNRTVGSTQRPYIGNKFAGMGPSVIINTTEKKVTIIADNKIQFLPYMKWIRAGKAFAGLDEKTGKKVVVKPSSVNDVSWKLRAAK